MTEAEALEIVAGKLVFGDERQIEAAKFLRNLEGAATAITKCVHRYRGEFCGCMNEWTESNGRSATTFTGR